MALPVTAVYVVLVCLAAGLLEGQMWVSFALLAVSSFLMMQLNNANALIRVYSRMVSCTFLVLSAMSTFLLASPVYGGVQLCLVAFYVLFFRAYQDKRAVGTVFYAFLMLGIASIGFVQILFFVPVLWILLYTNVMAGSVRTFSASVLGVLLPYWFAEVYYVYMGEPLALVPHFLALGEFRPLALSLPWSGPQLAAAALVLLLAIVGVVHFHRNSYMDKIRTRMLFEIFTTMTVCTVVFLLLQPQHVNSLLGMLIVSISPLVGHYVSLTRTRLTNISFFVFLLLALAVTAYNVWML